MDTFGQKGFLDEFRWENRILLVFSKDTLNSDYKEQLKSHYSEADEYLERDLRVFIISEESIFDESLEKIESTALKLRNQFSVQEDDFTVILIGKDGGEKLRSSKPIRNEKLFSTIDAMPMRRSEMIREKKDNP
ncbi:MAG: DUF4174 domain-containing protein [Bacteroidota bacterium]